MKFELDEGQMKKLNEWQGAIKLLHGEVGSLEYRFTPTGIGDKVEVYSKKANAVLDLTDENKW